MPTRDGGNLTLQEILRYRGASLEELRRQLSGDIDKIVMKTLRKDPSLRYRTAAELADDITNYLDGRPVNAEYYITMRDLPRPVRSDKMSLAILPLKIIGPGDEEDFLGVGLADALISRLSSVQRLVIRPTSSVLPFANSDPFEAAEKLGVDFVLDGNVRRFGSRLRVSVQLLNRSSRTTRWAKAFDEEMMDVLAVEDSISTQVAEALLPELTREERRKIERRGTDKPEAYQAYLRGRYFANQFTANALQRASEAYKEAVSIDPGYALPYVGLADFYSWAAIFGEISSHDGFTAAKDAARKALEIDPSLGEAYAALAFATLCYEWNWADAEYLVKQALELSPNYPFAHECYSNVLVTRGDLGEAVAEIRRAEELDPLSPRAMVMTSWVLYQSGQFEEAVEKARAAVELQEEFPQGLLHLGNALTSVGKPSEAVAVLRQSSEIWGVSGMPRYMLCHARAAEGNMQAARTILDKLLKTAERQYMKPYYIAMCYVAVGDKDNAFEWFERSLNERNEFLIWFGTEPKLESIRSDPRYADLLRRTSNPMGTRPARNTGETVQTDERERSIAVLPFRLLGGHGSTDSEDEYLTIGLADAVTMRLSNVRRFLVRPTSSVLPFAGSAADPFEAGRALGVEFVVDGNIRRSGERIRVTAQLLSVGENATRWSGSFDETFTDVLAIEDSISERVTRSLIPRLSGEEVRRLAKRGTDKPEAHEAYMQGRFFFNRFTPESYPRSLEAFERAVAIDPYYALAHVGIADYCAWACIQGIYSPREAYPNVLEAAARALELDPGLPEAYAAMGLYMSNNQKWEEAETNYRRALEIDPNYPLAHEWLSSLLVGTGRFDEGLEEIELAEQLDPVALRPKVLSAWTIYQIRDYGRALAKADELVALDPDFMQSHMQRGNVLLEMGRFDEALASAQRAAELAPESALPAYYLCYALAAAGREQEARSIVENWERRAENIYISPYFLGLARLAVGDLDAAFGHLAEAQEEKSAWMLWFGTEPKLDRVKDDPRYRAILVSTTNPIINRLPHKK